jgi:hypothetical protein
MHRHSQSEKREGADLHECMEEKFLSARETKDITDNVQGCEEIKVLKYLFTYRR